jgi:hypothetical protein
MVSGPRPISVRLLALLYDASMPVDQEIWAFAELARHHPDLAICFARHVPIPVGRAQWVRLLALAGWPHDSFERGCRPRDLLAWVDQMAEPNKGKRDPGRPPKKHVRADQRLADLWAGGSYKTKKDLADAQHLPYKVVKQALERERKRKARRTK